tara:strand:- start:899 stop:1453 length:555 start_codon:yes stop_codon:yes gene_type:complete
MTKWMTALLAAAALSAPATAFQGLDAQYNSQPYGPVTIAEITIGEALAEKVDDYGAREIDRLTGRLHDDLARELADMGWLAGDTAPAAILHVTIEDATPNRPTFAQTGSRPGLDMRSFGIGGAELTAELQAADGSVIATFEYAWESHDIRFAQYSTTWTDTFRTFDRFSTRLTDSLSDAAESGM